MKNVCIKLVLLANDYDPMKIKIALYNNALPIKDLSEADSIYKLFEEMTGIERQWIPFTRKINFFYGEEYVSCAHAIILPEEQNLLYGQWVAVRDITHDRLSTEDFEIFRTALGTI